ncbi:MAG: amino acid permease [Peptostreptococcaceae bacterium]|nr:amino acid permease [Peptostreptococcaceae bacterium]
MAIAIAGQQAFGTTGLIIATTGALFSTGSAINSTLFATGRLARKIATDHELPNLFKYENTHGITDRRIISISVISIGFALVGNLNQLVEGASFIFLFTFMIVNAIAFKIITYGRLYAAMGVIV